LINIKESDELDELTFNQAIQKDKRNIFQTFKSIILQKFDLIDIFVGSHKIRIILITQYIISLLFSYLFNALLYSDEIVSHKYHNNGKLDKITVLSVSIISNIISSIICYFLDYSQRLEERLELIMEVKIEFWYLYSILKFIKILKFEIFLYLAIHILIISISLYYIVIFSIVYKNSQISLLLNYVVSLVEDIIKNILISIIIVVTRKIGIHYINKYFYNLSKYINNRF
jgi:hypothetical protein